MEISVPHADLSDWHSDTPLLYTCIMHEASYTYMLQLQQLATFGLAIALMHSAV